ncbi:PKD domain-containing protein [Actinoplanes friuliensis]|jgi:hypothetical protein|uniref:PKD domain-containing protein n=1 Tax=Actinoplanes friuliensis DSM 7358 TaxID=1246995 RepID=U5WAJ8_9ACTN|nr:PKD domain-containing protein [Actinoplanes friuliensis]AGZ46218.1 hypothetical protein AFR_39820 [Actinoplanes friuliensis DSM 7358]
MNPRLTRPLLAIAISGAMFAGGAVVASPAFADPSGARESSTDALSVLEDPTGEPTPEPTATTEPTPEPTATTEPTPEPTATTDPTPEPTATTDPTPDPTVTTDPTPEPTATTTPAPDPTVTTDPADTTAPVGKFSLNTTALWIGQVVSLTQGAVTDNKSAATQITRTVNWGDGTSSTLPANTSAFKHKYAKNGRFTVVVTLKDAAGNTSKATAPSSTVAVTTPGKFKLSKYSVWSGESFKLTISNVPAGTTKLTLDWGDGWVQNLKARNQTVSGYYYHRKNGGLIKGAITLKTTFTNKYGATSAIYSGKVTVKTDSWKPVVKVKKPSSSDRIKSWKTVTGTSSDKGSGAPYVYVWGTRISGSKVYCTNSKKKWVRVNSDADFGKCTAITVKVSKGKWKMSLPGVAKGTLYIDARTWDWADNASKWSTVKAKITRS